MSDEPETKHEEPKPRLACITFETLTGHQYHFKNGHKVDLNWTVPQFQQWLYDPPTDHLTEEELKKYKNSRPFHMFPPDVQRLILVGYQDPKILNMTLEQLAHTEFPEVFLNKHKSIATFQQEVGKGSFTFKKALALFQQALKEATYDKSLMPKVDEKTKQLSFDPATTTLWELGVRARSVIKEGPPRGVRVYNFRDPNGPSVRVKPKTAEMMKADIDALQKADEGGELPDLTMRFIIDGQPVRIDPPSQNEYVEVTRKHGIPRRGVVLYNWDPTNDVVTFAASMWRPPLTVKEMYEQVVLDAHMSEDSKKGDKAIKDRAEGVLHDIHTILKEHLEFKQSRRDMKKTFERLQARRTVTESTDGCGMCCTDMEISSADESYPEMSGEDMLHFQAGPHYRSAAGRLLRRGQKVDLRDLMLHKVHGRFCPEIPFQQIDWDSMDKDQLANWKRAVLPSLLRRILRTEGCFFKGDKRSFVQLMGMDVAAAKGQGEVKTDVKKEGPKKIKPKEIHKSSFFHPSKWNVREEFKKNLVEPTNIESVLQQMEKSHQNLKQAMQQASRVQTEVVEEEEEEIPEELPELVEEEEDTFVPKLEEDGDTFE